MTQFEVEMQAAGDSVIAQIGVAFPQVVAVILFFYSIILFRRIVLHSLG